MSIFLIGFNDKTTTYNGFTQEGSRPPAYPII